nr:Acetoin:2,6-dichlorophenolindophenol oxidoreductase subunit alpha [Klebsiella pneumoniae]
MLSKQALLQAYRKMREIRTFEERLHQENTSGDIPGFIHLYTGEEAIAVGVRKFNERRFHWFNTPWTWPLYC